MTANGEVRKMLDERGVEWMPCAWEPQTETFYKNREGIAFIAMESTAQNGFLLRTDMPVTPAQAVAVIAAPQETSGDELRSCPFCGSSASLDVRLIEPNWWIACVMCDGINDHICSCQMIVSGDTRKQAIECAIESWNRRTE